MGKLIVFWSPWHGQAKVTASMGAVGVQLNRISGQRVVLTHSQFDMADLEGMFNRLDEEKRKLLYMNSGLSAAILRFKQSKMTKNAIEQCMVPLTSTGLYLLPGTEQSAMVAQETEIMSIVQTLLVKNVPEHYDWTLVDALSGNNPLSLKLLEAADVIVVTLSQNTATWEGYFNGTTPFGGKDNVFYLLGGYDASSVNNLKKFSHLYHIPEAQIGGIPYCSGYMDAISAGTAAQFIYMNENAKKRDENYIFVSESRRVAEKIKLFAERRKVE